LKTTVNPREEDYDEYDQDLRNRDRKLAAFVASGYLRLADYYRTAAPTGWG